MPMARLSGYMSDFAALLGESEHVHFSALEEKSTALGATVDAVAIPKVIERVSSIDRGDAVGGLRRAYDSINERLATDNATGSLTASRGRKADAIVLIFPGQNRPQPLDYGVIDKESALDGIPIRVGGSGEIVHVTLQGRNRTWSRIDVTREQAMGIAPYLFKKPIRLHGAGRWQRSAGGEWKLQSFRVRDYEALDDAPLSELVDELRAIPGSGWAEADDPAAILNELRHGDSDERPQ